MVRRVLVGGILVAASVPSLGLTLGSMQGQAHFGQPLNLRVPLVLSEGESADALCPVVRVFFANDPLPPSAVTASILPAESGGAAVLAIATRASLTEPFGRIDVVVGCSNQISRQYTVLTELPSTDRPIPFLPQTPVAVAIQAQRAAPPASASDVDAVRSAPATPKSEVSASARRAAASSTASAERPKASAAAAPRARVNRYVPPATDLTPPGSRLMLDPVELVAAVTGLSPSLRMTADLPVAPSDAEKISDELAQRREAARALWRVLNESPEQSAAAELKAEATAVEAERLRAELAAAKQLGADLQAQLQQERESLHRQPVVLVLGALVLMGLAAIAVFIRRRSGAGQASGTPWWKRGAAPVEGAAKKPSLMERGRSSLRTRTQRADASGAVARDVDIDVDTLFPSDAAQALKSNEPENRVSVSRVDPIGHPPSDFLPSALMDNARSVATEELFDLQQQVEFFISLGQSDQAIEVLLSHLAESSEPSPLAYLDLLKLYHELERRDDYERLRADFNRQFNGGAPAFDDYSYSRRGLERYESALSRIQALWPKPEVLALIERSIFRDGLSEVTDVFDLEAYRELLLLYGVAREVIGRDHPIPAMGAARGSDLLQSETGSTVLQPLQARTSEALEQEEAQLEAGLADFRHTQLDDSMRSVALGELPLDLDLSALGEAEAADADVESHSDGQTVSAQTASVTFSSPEKEAAPALAAAGKTPVTGFADDSDDLSFDLPEASDLRDFGDSRFPVKPAGRAVKTVPAAGAVDFDFSDLASLPPMSVRKTDDHRS